VTFLVFLILLCYFYCLVRIKHAFIAAAVVKLSSFLPPANFKVSVAIETKSEAGIKCPPAKNWLNP